MRRMSPVPDADHHVRFKPTIVPFLFLCGLKVSRVGINAGFFQSSEQEIALRGQAPR
jgi:hypothetical protein